MTRDGFYQLARYHCAGTGVTLRSVHYETGTIRVVVSGAPERHAEIQQALQEPVPAGVRVVVTESEALPATPHTYWTQPYPRRSGAFRDHAEIETKEKR